MRDACNLQFNLVCSSADQTGVMTFIIVLNRVSIKQSFIFVLE